MTRYITVEDNSINKYLEIIYNILQNYAALNADEPSVNKAFFTNYCSSEIVLKTKLGFSSTDSDSIQIFKVNNSNRTPIGLTTTTSVTAITFDNNGDKLKTSDCYVYYQTNSDPISKYYDIEKLKNATTSKKNNITKYKYFEFFIKYQIIKYIKEQNYKKKELKEASIKNELQTHLETLNYVNSDYDTYVKPILDILENINEYIFEKYEVVIECLYNYYLMVLLEENILYLESQDSYWKNNYFKVDDTNLDNLIVPYDATSSEGIEQTLIYAIAYLLNNYDLSSNYSKINNVLKKSDFFEKIFNLYGDSSITYSTGADINILIYDQATITDADLIKQYTYVEAITVDNLLNDDPVAHVDNDASDLDGYFKLILYVIRKEAENNFTNYTNLTNGDLLNILKYINLSSLSGAETTVNTITDFSDITGLDALITAESGSGLTKLDALRTYAKSWGTAVKITGSFTGSFDLTTFCSIADLKKAKLGSATKKIQFLLLCTLCVIKDIRFIQIQDATNEVIKLYDNFKMVTKDEDILQSVPARTPTNFTFLDCAILTGETLLNKVNTADEIITSFKQKIAEHIYSVKPLTNGIDFKTICSYISFTFDTTLRKITFTVKTYNQYPILLVPITTTAKFNVLQLNTNTLTDLPKCYGHLSELNKNGITTNDIKDFLTIESTKFADIRSDALLELPLSPVATYTTENIESLILDTTTYITAIKTKYSNAKNISDVKDELNAKLDSLIVSSDYNVDSTATATGINATKKALSEANNSYKENVDKYKTKNNELNNILKNNLYNNIFLYITIVVLILICLGLIYINNHKASLKTQYSVMLIAFLLLYYIIYTNVTVNITETFYSAQTTQQKFDSLHKNIFEYLLSLNSSEKIYGEALDKEKIKYDGFAKSSNSKLNSLELVLNDEFINAIKSKELVKFLILFTAICIISYIVYTNTEDPTTTSIIFIILFVIILAIYFYNINLMTRTKADTKYWNHRMVMK